MSFISNSIKEQFKKRKYFFESLFWGTLAGILSQGLNFIANILIARILGKQLLGEYTLFISANAGLHTFGVIGLNVIATVLVAKYLHDKGKIGRLIPAIYIIVCSASLIVSFVGIILQYLPVEFKIWETSSILTLIAAIIWFLTSALDLVQVAILLGFKAFKDVAKVSLLKGIISIAITYTLVAKYGVQGGVLGNSISFILSLICNYYFIRKNCQKYTITLTWKLSNSVYSEIFKLSIPIFSAAIFVAPAQWYANYIIYNTQGGENALSIFAIAYQWLVLIQFFPTQISRVALPWLTSMQETRDYKNTEKLGLYFSLGIATVIVILSLIFSHFIIEDLYHFEYITSHVVFKIILFTGLLSTINLYLGQTIIAHGETWIRTIADAAIAITLIITIHIINQHEVIYALPISYFSSFLMGTIVLCIFKYKLKI